MIHVLLKTNKPMVEKKRKKFHTGINLENMEHRFRYSFICQGRTCRPISTL